LRLQPIAVEGLAVARLRTAERKARMRKIAFVLISVLWLAGCESNLLLPMEPSPESVTAPRRALTEAEKETISDAVLLEIKDAHPPDFVWPHLVVRTHDGVTDYCGAVKTTGVAGRLENNKYYAQIRFDVSGKIAKVDVKSVFKDKGDNIPSTVDSLCMQDGYSFSPPPRP
jgi:hypothetical protein